MELQQFAFRGIPNASTMGMMAQTSIEGDEDNEAASSSEAALLPESPRSLEATQALMSQRKKHTELIHQLKGQLEELEGYAYESGEGDMPSSVLLERQRVVMEQLKARYNQALNKHSFKVSFFYLKQVPFTSIFLGSTKHKNEFCSKCDLFL